MRVSAVPGLAPLLAGMLLLSACSGSGGPALGGHDPVRLVEGEEVAGDPAMTLELGGFVYRFVDADSRARFEAEPARYAIQLEGRCARMGDVPGNPDIYLVHQERIYIFGSERCRNVFRDDPEAYLGVGVLDPGDVPDGAPVIDPGAEAPPQAVTLDWPQWGGPHRNFISDVTGLAATWPDEGPPRLWRRELGDGFSSIAVEDGRLYTMYRRGDDDVAIALDAASGETLWEYAYAAPFDKSYNMEYGPGPHATPLVAGDLVVTAGGTAKIHALDKATGRPLWQHDLLAEFGATLRPRGYSSSPLLWRDRVIVMAGGTGSAVMAFDRASGDVVWSRHDFANSTSSPIVIDVDGEEQIVAFMAGEIVGLDPTDGALLWRVEHTTNWGLNTSTPVWGDDGLLFVSSAYDGGSRMLELTRDASGARAEERWFSRKLRIHFGNAIRIADRVYGSSGDSGPAFFMALDARTGEVAWRQRGISRASFLLADGRFIILDEDGELLLATPTTAGLRIDSRVQLLQRVVWTVPSLAGKTLYIRDRKEIMALDLG